MDNKETWGAVGHGVHVLEERDVVSHTVALAVRKMDHVLEVVVVDGDGSTSELLEFMNIGIIMVTIDLNGSITGEQTELLEEAIADHRVDLHVLESVVVDGDGSASELLEESIADHGVDLQVLKAVVNGDWLQVLQEAM